jgi:hypothetical protein
LSDLEDIDIMRAILNKNAMKLVREEISNVQIQATDEYLKNLAG